MEHPKDRKYSTDHEWVRVADGVGTVGITHHAQDQLGDVVFVELPKVGETFDKGAQFGTVESVKSVSELYAPVAGKVVAVNESLEGEPELVNSDPHEGGWMLRLEIAEEGDLSDLMDADAYDAHVEG